MLIYMKDGFLSTLSPFAKILTTIVAMFACYLIFSGIGLISATFFFAIELSEVEKYIDPQEPANIGFLKYLQIIISIGLFIIPPLLLNIFFRSQTTSYLQTKIKPTSTVIIATVITMLFSLPIINLFATMNEAMNLPDWLSSVEQWMRRAEDDAKILTLQFLKTSTPIGLIINILMIAIIPAVGEELLFRGILQKIFSDWIKNTHVAILITALLFSAFHFQFYGFIPRLMLGLLFGYLFLWSRSIWLPILAHFINNAIAVFFYFFYGNDLVEQEINSLQTTAVLLVLSAAIASSSLFVIFKQRKPQVFVIQNIENHNEVVKEITDII